MVSSGREPPSWGPSQPVGVCWGEGTSSCAKFFAPLYRCNTYNFSTIFPRNLAEVQAFPAIFNDELMLDKLTEPYRAFFFPAAFSESTQVEAGLSFIVSSHGALRGQNVCPGSFPCRGSLELTVCNGWRLDKMEVGPGGIGQLVVAEGFFIGEKDIYKVLNKQGRRYRLRPSAQDRKDGKSVPGIFQLGPFKIHLEQCFRGSGGEVDLLSATRATEAWQDGLRTSQWRSSATAVENPWYHGLTRFFLK